MNITLCGHVEHVGGSAPLISGRIVGVLYTNCLMGNFCGQIWASPPHFAPAPSALLAEGRLCFVGRVGLAQILPHKSYPLEIGVRQYPIISSIMEIFVRLLFSEFTCRYDLKCEHTRTWICEYMLDILTETGICWQIFFYLSSFIS